MFTFSHFADAFIQSDLQLGNTWSDSSWRGKQTEEVLIIPSLRHCSNKYKIAREGEKETNSYFLFYIVFLVYDEVKQCRKRWVFSCCLKIDSDPAFRIGVGRSFKRCFTSLYFLTFHWRALLFQKAPSAHVMVVVQRFLCGFPCSLLSVWWIPHAHPDGDEEEH